MVTHTHKHTHLLHYSYILDSRIMQLSPVMYPPSQVSISFLFLVPAYFWRWLPMHCSKVKLHSISLPEICSLLYQGHFMGILVQFQQCDAHKCRYTWYTVLIVPASVRASFQTREEKYDHIKGRECSLLLSCLSIYMLRGLDVIVILQVFNPIMIVSINVVPEKSKMLAGALLHI